MHATDSGNGSADQDRKWYVIHTYSGYENKVKTNLEHRIESMGVQDKIFQVVIPPRKRLRSRMASAARCRRRSTRATSWSKWPWTTMPGTSCGIRPASL